MQFIKADTHFDFLGKRKIGFVFSLILILAGLVSLIANNGPNYGIDFAGGTLIQMKFHQEVAISDIRDGLDRMGIKDASVQNFGQVADHEYLIRTASADEMADELAKSISKGIQTTTGQTPDIRRVEMVGPQVGKDLKSKALLAIFLLPFVHHHLYFRTV